MTQSKRLAFNGDKYTFGEVRDITAAESRGQKGGVAAHLAQNIAAQRNAHGWSKTDLARELSDRGWDVQRQTIHKIENLDRSVSAEELCALADVFETSLNTLVQTDDRLKKLYKTATTKRVDASNAVASYRYAQQRLMDALAETEELDELTYNTYLYEAEYPHEELQKDSEEIFPRSAEGDL